MSKADLSHLHMNRAQQRAWPEVIREESMRLFTHFQGFVVASQVTHGPAMRGENGGFELGLLQPPIRNCDQQRACFLRGIALA
ncbi:hypothetical protein D3C78_1443170 [compost metagenome]